MVKVESLLIEEASLTVGGGDEARPLMLVKRGRVLVVGCWCLQVRTRKQLLLSSR
jgi:hypothetical protein